MSSRKNSLEEFSAPREKRLLRISEVARRVGISSSALRAWEALGLVTPQRTQSRYRLYGESEVRLLHRAILSHQHSFSVRNCRRESKACPPFGKKNSGNHAGRQDGIAGLGQHGNGAASFPRQTGRRERRIVLP